MGKKATFESRVRHRVESLHLQERQRSSLALRRFKRRKPLGRFLIGAGGWAYFHVPGGGSLSAYARAFDFVEVNSTFYEYPTIQTARLWRKEVSADFEFAVRCHQDLTYRNRLEPSDANVACLEKMLEVCEALKASVLHVQIPAEMRLGSEMLVGLRDLFESVSFERIRVALETGRGRTQALGSEMVSIMRDLNIVHCVDLSQEEPVYRSDLLYTRLFGPTGDNIHQFADEELIDINTKASRPEFEKSILAFHGVKMYKDAARLRTFRSSGRFPMITSAAGPDSLREVLSEDMSFPASKANLIRHQGWKIIDLTAERRVHAAKVLANLPDRDYRSVEDVLVTLKDLDFHAGAHWRDPMQNGAQRSP